jgi:hypothetical protein
MNTPSEPRPHALARRFAPAALLAAVLALGACIQGPWDYYPNDPPVFRGLSATGYVIAGQPLRHVCFERILDIAEEATDAFPFYDSADVRITGRFSGQERTVALTPVPDTANCFLGDTGAVAERGQSYDLVAAFGWDSAGSRVVSTLRATANVPTDFRIHDTAAAPKLAETGGIPTGARPEDFLGFFEKLPPEVRDVMQREYGAVLLMDSLQRAIYLRKNLDAIQERLVQLMRPYKTRYGKNDSMFYLNGFLSTLTHYFSSSRSPDVKGVLLTHRFDPEGSRMPTVFSNLFGNGDDTSNYYYRGYIRRLILYPDAHGPNDWNLLDSMGFVNAWFMSKWNRVYFYAVEKAYVDYHSTNTSVEGGGGGGQEGDPRIKPEYNVQGGIGIFAGMIPDSFDVYVKVDSLTDEFPIPKAHVADCREDGWLADQDCREFYRPACSARDWRGSDCWGDAVIACLEADFLPDSPAKDSLRARCSPMADSLRAVTTLPEGAVSLEDATLRFCVVNDFPATEVCDQARGDCRADGLNRCKEMLWDYCKDNLWKPEQCGFGLAAYCKEKDRPSEIMCSRADAWCAANPGARECTE